MATSVFDDLLSKLIGSQTNTNVDEQLGVKNLIDQLQQGQQNTTGVTTNTSQTTADTGRLADVFARQSAGITPEMLQSIFREGAKAAPQLVSNTANAVGARSAGNSPLATAFNELNTNLVGQAAQLNASMLRDAGTTAAQIGSLTKGTTDTQNTNQAVTNNQHNLTDQTQNSTKASDTVARTTINAKSSALTAGVAGLLSLLQGSGLNASSIAGIVSKLFGGDAASGITSSNGTVLNPGDADNPFSNPGIDPGLEPDWGGGGWADGGLVGVPKLGFDSKKATGPTNSQLLALGNGGGFSLAGLLSGGGGSTGAGGQASDSQSGGSSSSGTTDSSTPSSVGNISQASNQTAVNVALGLVGMVPGISQAIAIGKALQNLQNVPSMLPPNITFDPSSLAFGVTGAGDDGSGGIGGTTGIGSVSAGPATATDAATGESVGVDGAAGVGTSTSGSVGADGDGGDGDGGGDGGWANGGLLPLQHNDPKGNKDTMLIPASGGEYVMPTDVVAIPGMHDFLELIRKSFHKGANA